MTEHLTCAQTAKLIRQALKSAFPGQKFSVRSHTYAGGASIDIGWTDGPTEPQVDALGRLYAGATFDGMIDLKSYHTSLVAAPDGAVSEVWFGADFVFTRREVSQDWKRLCTATIPQASDGLDDRASQCGHCGDWTPPGDRWCAKYIAHNGFERVDFCCSRECAGAKVARWTAAPLGVSA